MAGIIQNKRLRWRLKQKIPLELLKHQSCKDFIHKNKQTNKKIKTSA